MIMHFKYGIPRWSSYGLNCPVKFTEESQFFLITEHILFVAGPVVICIYKANAVLGMFGS